MYTISPTVPEPDGTDSTYVIVLDGDKPPVKSIEWNSAPLSDVTVSFSVIVVGALILTVVLLLPSTVKPSLINALSKITSSLPLSESAAEPEPVVVGTGMLNVDSVPSCELTTLLPIWKSPASFTPV